MVDDGPSLAEILGPAEDERRTGAIPGLPVEAPLVRAVRELEGLKTQAETLLLLLERVPDGGPLITDAVNSAIGRLNAASAAIWQFQEIRSCRGQA